MNKKLKLAKSKTISYLKLPFDFLENHFREFSPYTVKVYLYILYLCTLGDIEFDDKIIASRLNISVNDLKHSYRELREAGMLIKDPETNEEELVNPEDFYKEYYKEVKHVIKKDSDERLRNAAGDKDYQKQMEFIEDRFGKELSKNDYLEIFDMLENLKIPYEVLIAAIDYSVSKNIRSFSYIAKIALNWKELGLTNYESCEEYLSGSTDILTKVKKMMKIDRELLDVEIKYISDWYYKMGKTEEEIEAAIKTAVLNTGKISFPYINAILEDKKKKQPELKTGVKKPSIHNFPEREYDFDEIISGLRKKQKK